MLVKLEYHVRSSALVDELWPIDLEGLHIDWHTTGGLIDKVTVQVRAKTGDHPPTMTESDDPAVAANINLGVFAQLDVIERRLRAIQGLLTPFMLLEIDFDSLNIVWIAETEEEEKSLTVTSFSRKRIPSLAEQPSAMSFDYFVRAMIVAPQIEEREAALNFIRRGRSDLAREQYIEAYYDFFFYLETLFAPGLSKSAEVKKRLRGSSRIRKVLPDVRQDMKVPLSKIFNGHRLINMTDEDLLDHLVDVRGSLHHHSLRKPGVWHPDRQHEFEAETRLLHTLVSALAMGDILPLLYTEEVTDAMMETAVEADAVVQILGEIVLTGVAEPVTVLLRGLGTAVTNEAIDQAHQKLRNIIEQRQMVQTVKMIRILSADRNQVYAVYERQNTVAG
ncbi:hypothetical protein [Geminicoccus flavidas]|uniref:hypothetical protein n=1 Tax=Geminicoccus flavidas TaxID=2506407 RepID=UPI00135A5F06|nr:hypothetical protein [Geminicoccus flavidas]